MLRPCALPETRTFDSDQVALAAVKQIRESKRGFGLPYAAGTDQHEDADRLVGIVETRARGVRSAGR